MLQRPLVWQKIMANLIYHVITPLKCFYSALILLRCTVAVTEHLGQRVLSLIEVYNSYRLYINALLKKLLPF